jgi:hypothetical protein
MLMLLSSCYINKLRMRYINISKVAASQHVAAPLIQPLDHNDKFDDTMQVYQEPDTPATYMERQRLVLGPAECWL